MINIDIGVATVTLQGMRAIPSTLQTTWDKK